MKKARGMLPEPVSTRSVRAVRVHEIVEVRVEGLASSGDGVARLVAAGDSQGPVVFVAGTAPGDVARVRVVKAKKRFVKARLVEVMTPGPDRVPPPCDYAAICGGCDWQHIDYAAQLRAKQRQLGETLARIGGLTDIAIEPIAACKRPLHYRHRVQGDVHDGGLHFHRRGSGEPVRIERCLIADERINEILAAGLPTDVGGRVELAVIDGAVSVVPVDDERTTERGFTQVNDAMAEQLEARVLAAIAAGTQSNVLDLYCGAGAWTCRIAAAHPERRVIGVELHAGNVQLAEQRRRRAGLANVSFRAARVERAIRSLPLADSICIVDPPRAGLDALVVQALMDTPAARLVYVSCHPATLARDLAALAEAYVPVRIEPLDMFPQTAHLEVCVTLAAR